MRKIIFLFFIIACVSISAQDEFRYRFTKDKPLTYEIKLEGTLCFGHESTPQQEFDMAFKTNLSLNPQTTTDTMTVFDAVAKKTLIRVSQMVLEDTTWSETLISQMIPSFKCSMLKNGKIQKIRQMTPGIEKIPQFLNFFPVFPEKLTTGMVWKQSIPPIPIPGIPTPGLKFSYVCEGKNNQYYRFRVFSNQVIMDTQKRKNRMVKLNGLNVSEGYFLFDRNMGEIQSFSGNFDITLKIVFSAIGQAKQETDVPVPLNARIKLRCNITKKTDKE